MRAIRIGLYFLRRGWYLSVGSGRNVILGVFAITMALLLWGVVMLLEANLAGSLGNLGSDLKARAYLESGTTEADGVRIAELVRQSPAAESVRQVDSQTAAAELTSAFPDLATVADADAGVVNGYVEWIWRQDVDDEPFQALVEEIEANQAIAWLDDDRPWRGRMQVAAARLRSIGLVLGVLSIIAAGFITATVVRLAAFRHRVEIEVERLAGATELYVRGPFLVAGVIQGTAAAGVAIGLLYAFWEGVESVVGDTVLTDLMLGSFLSTARLVLLAVVGAVAGAVGAAIALRPPRHPI